METRITQQLLAEFQYVKQQRAAWDERRKRLRDRLLEEHRSGAPVETGELTFEVRSIPTRRISQAVVREAFGEEVLQELLDTIEPTVEHRVYVGHTARSDARTVTPVPIAPVSPRQPRLAARSEQRRPAGRTSATDHGPTFVDEEYPI